MLRFLWLTLLLAGCASAPVALQRPAGDDAPFSLNGRVSIKQGDRRDNAGLRWEHRAGADEILLLAPLGQAVARIRRDDAEATLEASGNRYRAPDAEALMQQVLGWQIPLSGLRYWITARPAAGAEAVVERNAAGQIDRLRQQGWEVVYARYADTTAEALPLRLTLYREGLEVLLLIDEWEAQ